MNESQCSLNSLIGSTIEAMILIWSADPIIQKFKLHGVEAGGLWLESQDLTNKIFGDVGIAGASKTLVAFVPYNHIQFVMGFVDQFSLSEEALGL